jgi:D-alanyl-lipoteichoic acid acyltransferase DltB (MBOAT superfamily)
MLFTELRFLVFFAVVFVVHWALRGNTARKIFLLVVSYAFYAGWDWRFLGLIVASTLVDYIAGRALGREGLTAGQRRGWMIASLIVNLGILGLFKYYDFFVTSAVELSAWLGLPLSARTLSLTLPVGISFYTFQTLSYTLDVYRERLAPVTSLLDFSLFVAFFPQLVAGPIVRASTFLPQLDTGRSFAKVLVRQQLTLFLIGYVKKACVADNLAAAIDPVFADPAGYSTAALWVALFLYGVQIYCDFSGYSDMAIAVAGLLGYELALNFYFPYLATTVTEFWRRWHISLSTWFRDYLYLPLGGNRGSAARTYFNLATVFVLCGLWHGASWNFVVWGVVHGALLIAERITGWRNRVGLALPGWAVTQLCVMLAWIPFRTANLASAGSFLGGMFGATHRHTQGLSPELAWLLLALLALHAATYFWKLPDRLATLPPALFAPAFGLLAALVLPFAAANYQPFIYFQF